MPLPDPQTLKGILFIRLSSLGDVVKCVPAYRALCEAIPGARVTWLVDERFAKVLHGQPGIHCLVIPASTRGLRGLRQAGRAVAGLAPQVVVDAHGSFRAGYLARASGAAHRIGFGRGFHKEGWFNSLLMTHRIHPRGLFLNRRALAMALVARLGARDQDLKSFLVADKDQIEKARETFSGKGPHVIIHPGSSKKGFFKRWSPERWVDLSRALVNGLGSSVHIVYGGDEEAALAGSIADEAGPGVQLLPDLPWEPLLGHLATADLVVGADSGPVHVADALGTPVVSIHGPKDPRRYGPLGARAQVVSHFLDCSLPRGAEGPACRLTQCGHLSCIRAISVQEVLAAVVRALA
jgi:ADP-heptose:LPS heptosyltransferase